MELRHLRTFLAIAEAGSITGAARRLHIAQPAVTRQLRQLEASVGNDLFDRSPHGVTPTTVGALLELKARRLVAQADALVDDLRHDRTTVGGTLRVAVVEEGIGPLTPVVLAAYRAAHPNVTVVVDDGCDLDAIENLAKERDADHDVALWSVDPDSQGLVGTGVYGERLQLAISEQSEMASATAPVPVADVLDLPIPNMGTFLNNWTHLHHLSAHRNGAPPRLAHHPAEGLSELIRGLSTGDFAICMTPNTAAMPGVSLIDIETDSTVMVGAILKEHEQRQHVKNFADIAHAIGTELYHLVPEAGPPSTTTATSPQSAVDR